MVVQVTDDIYDRDVYCYADGHKIDSELVDLMDMWFDIELSI